MAPTPSFDSGRIHLIGSAPRTLNGVDYLVSYYENPAYRCGRSGVFPFLVVEQAAIAAQPKPLWVLLRGGGIGFYDNERKYVGREEMNDQETPEQLIATALAFLGDGGRGDTFLGDRIRAGDRVALGSLCDHDLMLGLGQPYPNDPTADTVDGLLANLAMVTSVRDGTAGVTKRPTTSTWVYGTSAGAYGAYGLAHNLLQRQLAVDGVVMDSGVLTARSESLFKAGATIGDDGARYDSAAISAKVGPYYADAGLHIENQVAAGFRLPLFDVVESGDPTCGGTSPPVPAAVAAGYSSNCDWLHGSLADAIKSHGVPALQQVHIYPGQQHTASFVSGHPMQTDLRKWFALASRQ